MSFGTRLVSAAEAAAERYVAERLERIAGELEYLADLLVAAERRRVVVRGARLAKRRLSDPALRFAGLSR